MDEVWLKPCKQRLESSCSRHRLIEAKKFERRHPMYCDAVPLLSLGLAGSAGADYIAIDWSDGVFQTELDLHAGQLHRIVETQRQLASCPVLFAWDGTRYAFVTDLLGVGGLGFFVEPGVYGEPRPWERLLLPDGLLQARDDRFVLKLTEPMEEVTYLDSSSLLAYDLPPGWSFVLDERFAINGPAPTGDALYYRHTLEPVRAVNDRGDDVRADITANDGRAAPTGALDRRFVGRLEHEHTLELDFATPLDGMQGRPVLAKDPSTPQVPIIEHADVKRMLLAQKAYVEGGMALLLYCAKLVDLSHSAESDEERDSTGLLLDILTPVGKSWPSQWCLEANNLAIQVHGGYGYTREYDVEQHYRDNRLNPIHEGTHGIQSLDLLGRKVTQRGGASLAALGHAVGATIATANAAGGETADLATQLDSTWQRLITVTAAMFSSGDTEAALANSVIYLEAFGHIVVAWMWLEQLLAANGRTSDFYDGKRQAARYFFRYELPKTAPQLDLLESVDRTTLEMRDGWF